MRWENFSFSLTAYLEKQKDVITVKKRDLGTEAERVILEGGKSKFSNR